MKNEIKATIVFEQIWKAIHARNPDGTRKYRYIVNRGSSRSSKTRSIIQAYWLYALSISGQRMSVWRDTKKDARDTVGYDMSVVYPAMIHYPNVTFNKTEASYAFPNKSIIEINGTDDENKVMGYNGDVAWFNEPYKISRGTFDQIDQRTVEFIIIDWNPKMAHWILDLEKDERTIVITSTFKDNPFCPPEQKIKILSYQPVSACRIVKEKILPEVEAKSYNLTDNPKGLPDKFLIELSRCKENERKNTASAFNWSVYGLGEKAEKPNRIFHWTEISDDEYNKINVKRYYGSDWGVVDPWGVIEAKYLDGNLYLRQLNYDSENQLKAKLSMTEIEQVNAKDEGLVMWHFERLGIPKKEIILCDDNRPMKIVALRAAGYDYAVAAGKGPGSILEGISVLEKLRVFFTSSSTNLKYEQENYSRVTDRYGVVQEEAEDFDNHLIDPTRYIILFLKAQGIIKII